MNSKEIGIIFDMDGTMVNNANYHRQAWVNFLKKYNIRIKADDYHKKMFGYTSKEILGLVFKKELSEIERTELAEEKEKMYRELYSKHIRPQPGLIDLIRELHRNNIKIAVATSAIEKNLHFVLSNLDIKHYFHTTTNSSQIRLNKPYPDIYLKTANDLNLDPEACLVFEDSPPGIEAAIKAGMKAVAINPSEINKIRKLTNYIYPDFREIDLELIRKIIN